MRVAFTFGDSSVHQVDPSGTDNKGRRYATPRTFCGLTVEDGEGGWLVRDYDADPVTCKRCLTYRRRAA